MYVYTYIYFSVPKGDAIDSSRSSKCLARVEEERRWRRRRRASGGTLLPSIEIPYDRNHVIYAIARARTTTPLAYVLLRVHKKKLVRSSAAPQTMGRARGRLGEKGGMKGTTVWREEARDDRDANSFCSLPRLLRPFLRMQIVGGRRRPLECVSRSEGVRARAREGERIKVRARAKDYEYSSFTISGGSVTYRREFAHAVREISARFYVRSGKERGCTYREENISKK